jgi:SAM-dependent methyltransferase
MDKTLRYYNDNAKAFVEGTLSADVSGLYAFFQKYVKPGAAILDLGCGSGRDSLYFLSQGYQVCAIDGSEELCKLAAELLGQPVECKLFQDIDDVDRFDGIWACSSLLHVPYEELPAILDKLHTALKAKGYLYLSAKYGTFSGERNGRYFTDLDEARLEALLQKTKGFSIIETDITTDVRPGREDQKWLNAILQKQ